MRENISFDSKETLIQQLHLDIKTAKTTNIVGLSF
jgi:FAD synthase